MSYNAFKERLERDKTPKSLFVEMDVLKEDIWQEQARWIKFEEDLMEGADRWGYVLPRGQISFLGAAVFTTFLPVFSPITSYKIILRYGCRPVVNVIKLFLEEI